MGFFQAGGQHPPPPFPGALGQEPSSPSPALSPLPEMHRLTPFFLAGCCHLSSLQPCSVKGHSPAGDMTETWPRAHLPALAGACSPMPARAPAGLCWLRGLLAEPCPAPQPSALHSTSSPPASRNRSSVGVSPSAGDMLGSGRAPQHRKGRLWAPAIFELGQEVRPGQHRPPTRCTAVTHLREIPF